MVFDGNTSVDLLKNLKEKFEKLNEKSESVKLTNLKAKKKLSKWIETCRLIEGNVPDYLLKRFKEYY